MDSRSFLIFALVVLAVFHTGEAIKCYQCNSMLGSESCTSKELQSKHEQDCGSNSAELCMACTVHMEDGKDHINRQCINAIAKTQAEIPKVESMDCRICTKDLCNGASTNMLTLGWLGLLWAIRSIFAGAY